MINWYPGHMVKAQRIMGERLREIDVVFQLLDARAPLASLNPQFDQLFQNKPKIYILNKSDIADDEKSREWIKFLQEQINHPAVLFEKGEKKPWKILEKIIRERKFKTRTQVLKAMVCGIPNVGKSTFINLWAGKKLAATGNRPGLTQQVDWIKSGGKSLLMDTPGIFWPRFENSYLGYQLALIGCVKYEVIPKRAATHFLLKFLIDNYPKMFIDRYKLHFQNDILTDNLKDMAVEQPDRIIELVAHKRKFYLSGEPNLARTEEMLLKEFRNGVLGKMSFSIKVCQR